MAIDVIMPKLGESITEGTILEWKKALGDSIERDETLLEISTDKVDSEIPSPASGTLLEILYEKNTTVDVGKVIARIGEVGEKIDSQTKSSEKEDNKKEKETVTSSDPKIVLEEPEEKVKKVQKQTSNKFYSPLVKSIAKKEGVDFKILDSIEGTGHNGRVNKYDILEYLKKVGSSSLSIDSVSTPNEYHLEDKTEPMGHIRKIIAEHMI